MNCVYKICSDAYKYDMSHFINLCKKIKTSAVRYLVYFKRHKTHCSPYELLWLPSERLDGALHGNDNLSVIFTHYYLSLKIFRRYLETLAIKKIMGNQWFNSLPMCHNWLESSCYMHQPLNRINNFKALQWHWRMYSILSKRVSDYIP